MIGDWTTLTALAIVYIGLGGITTEIAAQVLFRVYDDPKHLAWSRGLKWWLCAIWPFVLAFTIVIGLTYGIAAAGRAFYQWIRDDLENGD